jgi:hypothetical protein
MVFYKHFVFPRQFGKSVPAVDWSADPDAILAQLAQVADDDVRDVLERDLWAHRKLYGATGRVDLAEQLHELAQQAFPHSGLRYIPATGWLNTTLPTMSPARVTPKTLVLLGQLLLAWMALTAGGLLLLLIDFIRGSTLAWPFKGAWLLITLFFGPLALLAYRISDQRLAQESKMAAWRRALGPAMYRLIGPAVCASLGLYLYAYYRPNSDMGPGYLLLILAAAFLLNWPILQAPLRAWAQSEPYWAALRRTTLVTAATTILATIILLATGQLLSSIWLGDIPPTSPYFLIYSISGSLVASVFVYAIEYWRSRRGLGYWPAQSLPSGQARSEEAASTTVTPAYDG